MNQVSVNNRIFKGHKFFNSISFPMYDISIEDAEKLLDKLYDYYNNVDTSYVFISNNKVNGSYICK